MRGLVTRALVVASLAIATLVPVADARQYAWLGVRIRDLAEQEMEEIASRHGIREGFGVFIVEVIDATPAAAAGVKSGDVVVALNDRPVVDTRMLQRLIGSTAPGSDVRVTVLRAEGRRQLGLRLAAMPKPIAGERVAAEFGFVIRDPDAGEREAPRAAATRPAVVAVMRGSAADRAGLEVGDVILAIEDRPAASRDAVREALADVLPERPLRLIVARGDRQIALTLPVP